VGHIFDYRTTPDDAIGVIEQTISSSSFTVSSCPSIEFNDNYVVFGNFGGFQRGGRGWGSGSGFSVFQQNPDNTPIETAADLFLNWVYRRNSPNSNSRLTGVQTNGSSPTSGCVPLAQQVPPVPEENWSGFSKS